MTGFPFLSEQYLVDSLRGLSEKYAQNKTGLPEWIEKDAKTWLKETKLIICGSNNLSEIGILARNANIIGIVDDYKAKQGLKIYGIPVISADDWVTLAKGDNSIVTVVLVQNTPGYLYFMQRCTQWELKYIDPIEFLHLLKICEISTKGETGRFFWYGYEFFQHTLANMDLLLALRLSLIDHYSRFSWLCVMMYRTTLNPYYLQACAVGHGYDGFRLNSYSTNRQFMQFSEQEVYVDGGAYTGDTIELFLRAVEGKFKHIYSFEPSDQNSRQIMTRLRDLQCQYLTPLIPNTTLITKGLWDSDTVLQFNPGGATQQADMIAIEQVSAHMIETGLLDHLYADSSKTEQSFINVPVTTIDTATNLDATFIKMEIEGSELQALNGAKKTIEKNRPKMAISIYHKPEDLITLTNFVKETGHNYKLGFRQHNSLCPDAMVLYCY